MPITTSDMPSVRALTVGLRAIFEEAYQSRVQESLRSRLATDVRTNSEAEDYAWLGAVPQVREYTDERQVKAITGFSYTIANKVWENTIAVDRAALDHDKYGLIRMRIQDMAAEAARYQDQLVIETLANGFTATCYDGLTFFSDSHTGGDNKTTSALSATALQDAITAMMNFKDDQNKPMGITPDTLVVPPALQWTARELLESGVRPEADYSSDNVLKGALKLVVTPYLTDADNWYVLSTGRSVRPLIFQEDAPVEFQAMESDSESGFMRDQFLYGTYARYNVGFGLWQCAYGAVV